MDTRRYVYGLRIYMDRERIPMAELAFGDGGRPTGETAIIRWDEPEERERYVINAYTFIWDERTKEIWKGESFQEYVKDGAERERRLQAELKKIWSD